MTEQQERVFTNFVDGLMRFNPAERVEIMHCVRECYCLECGYPAPPKGVGCIGCETPAPIPQDRETP